MSGAVQTEKAADLETLRSRIATLSNRRDALKGEIAKAGEREHEAAERLAATKEALATGSGGQADVARATKLLDDARQARAHLEEALQKVAGEHDRIGSEVVRIERELERQRQNEAAEVYRQKVTALRAKRRDRMANFAAESLEIAAIAKRVKAEHPLADGIEEDSLDTMSVELCRDWHVDWNARGSEARAWIVRGHAGPSGVLDESMMKIFHLKR